MVFDSLLSLIDIINNDNYFKFIITIYIFFIFYGWKNKNKKDIM